MGLSGLNRRLPRIRPSTRYGHFVANGDQSDSAFLAFLASLRRRGHEAQFTQMIAGACKSDPQFAADFVRTLVRAAGDRGTHVQVPERLICRPEEVVYSELGRDLGRVDLVFRDPDADFLLLVELKLHSAYGNEQLERYQQALESFPGDRRYLVAVTVASPFVGEATVSTDPRWLGSLRWATIVTQLRALRHESPAVETAWRGCLDLMRDQGDFGLMDIDPTSVAAWARALEGEEVLKHLLREAAIPVESMLSSSQFPVPEARLIARGKARSQPVVPWRGRLHVPYSVGSQPNEPRFRIQFHARGGIAMFSCEARYEHRKEHVRKNPAIEAASSFLDRADYEIGTDYEGWYWSKSLDPSGWFSSATPLQELLDFTRSAIDELAESAVWTALQSHTPVTPLTETPKAT
jgi:hypothetical protein